MDSTHGLMHACSQVRLVQTRPSKQPDHPSRVAAETLLLEWFFSSRVPRDQISIELEDIHWADRARARFLVPAPAVCPLYLAYST